MHRLEKKLAQIDAKIEKMELDKKTKEDLKTVALGTSKINYLDPRISVAWCKRHEVPIEKVRHTLSIKYKKDQFAFIFPHLLRGHYLESNELQTISREPTIFSSVSLVG